MENVTNIINEKKFTSTKLVLDNRKKLQLTGVEKALSSNDDCVVLQVSGTKVYIAGHNLHILKLDVETGVVDIEGEIDSLKYGTSKVGFFKRIFK